MLDVDQFQKEHADWAYRNFPHAASADAFDGIVEELGELAHARLKARQGIRGTNEEHEEKTQDAIGDMFIYMCHFCTILDWNIGDIIHNTWQKVRRRDWEKFPVNGVNE